LFDRMVAKTPITKPINMMRRIFFRKKSINFLSMINVYLMV